MTPASVAFPKFGRVIFLEVLVAQTPRNDETFWGCLGFYFPPWR